MDREEDRKALADGMRQVAWLIENGDVPYPNMFDAWANVSAWHSLSKEELGNLAITAAKHGLDVKKQYVGNSFTLGVGNEKFRFASHSDRQVVCTRIDTGEVEEYQGYPEGTELVTKTRPKYEWKCDPLLAPSEDGETD